MRDESIKEGSKKDQNAEQSVDYDTLLSSAGEFGRYQILLIFSTLPFYFFGVNVYFSQLFMTETPTRHWCWIPELQNLTQDERRDLAIPKTSDDRFGYSHCETYDVNWADGLTSGSILNSTATVPCQNGWEFDRTEIPYPTISTDYEWVCDKKSYQATAQAIFFFGSVVGSIFMGWLADRYGRVPATITSNLVGCVGGLASTFTTTFTEFAICRFVMGMAYDTCMLLPDLIVIEYAAPKYRSILANASFAVFFSLFATLYPFLALACGHWKTISLVSSIPLASSILALLFLPESPRWLLSKGRYDEVISKIEQIARVNKKQISPDLINKFKETYKLEEELSALEVFKRPVLRKNLVLVCLVYMSCLIVFDGLYRNLNQLEFNFFYSFAASNAMELPSGLLCAFIIDYLGRRWLTVMMLTINSVACVLIMFVEPGIQSVICAVIARFAVNVVLSIALQWSAELLPTPVRGSGVSLVIICGNVGVILSPCITYLKVVYPWLPYVIMGSIAAFGATMAVILPETAKRELPHTFKDAEMLNENQRFWEMPCLKKRNNHEGATGAENSGFEL